MKKVLILTVAIFVAMSTFVIAATKDYYQKYRAPMYGTYRPTMPYGNMQPPRGYGNMPLMYGNHRPPMNYENRPPMYGQMPPYGNMQSPREGRPPMHYGNCLQCTVITALRCITVTVSQCMAIAHRCRKMIKIRNITL